MSTGGTIAVTIVLAIVAAITAGLWLAILTWPVGIVVNYSTRNRPRDERVRTGTAVMNMATMVLATAAVLIVGLLIGLPWYAAALAGLFVGMTSYVRPTE